MIRRATWLLLAPGCLLAQLQLVILDRSTERPVTGFVQLGVIDPGDTLTAALRVRNRGPASVRLRVLSVNGAGFTLASPPPLPFDVPGGGSFDFTVRFESRAPGDFGASLNVNTDTMFLRVGVRAGPLVSVQAEGPPLVLASGAAVDFGAVERGSARSRRFRLANPADGPLRISSVGVSGAAWRVPVGLALPLDLAAREAVSFEVKFEPAQAGLHEGALEVEGRSFRLTGSGLEPPFPKPQILLEPSQLSSGQQARLTVRLASPSRRAGSGELRLEFTAGTPGATDDPAIRFLSPAGRVVTFTVDEGAGSARFGERGELEFQTGTTAGQLTFFAELGEHAEQVAVRLAPQPVVIDSARVSRAGVGLEVQLTGFDNSRSVSQAVFTWLDASDRPVEPGPIRVDVAAEFRRYFETSALGGVFALRAAFPVTGDASRIAAVEAEVTNSIGTTRTERLRF